MSKQCKERKSNMDNKTKRVLGLIGHLDDFMGGLSLPRQLHVQWQGLYQDVVGRVQETLVPKDVPGEVPEETPKVPDHESKQSKKVQKANARTSK
jgi:hypothetical protein